MTPEEYEARSLYEQLQPGDRVEVIHGVRSGSSANWTTKTTGKVLRGSGGGTGCTSAAAPTTRSTATC